MGSIHQTFKPGVPVKKGDEKGFFSFGGSSTLLMLEPGTIAFSQDLTDSSAKIMELYAKMGTEAGTCV